MKKIIVLIGITLMALPSFANQGYCYNQAREEMLLHHKARLKKIGVIQGYSEDISMSYSKKQTEIDQLDETYTFEIQASNDEDEWWVTKYQVKYETWLSVGLESVDCVFMEMTYFGVVDQSTQEG